MNRSVSSRGRLSGHLGTLLVVLLVVLAGCAGGGGDVGGGGTGATADGAAGPSGNGTPGDSGGPDGTDGIDGVDDRDSTAGDGGGSVDDIDDASPEEAYREHASNLREFGSYTATYDWTVEGNDTGDDGSARDTSVRGTVRADLDADSAHLVQTMEGDSDRTTTAELFWPAEEETVYTRLGTGEGAVYRTSPREESRLTLFTDPMGGAVLPSTGMEASPNSLAGYRDEGVVSTAAGPRHRYVFDGRTAAGEENVSGDSMADYYVEILVDEERGIVTDYRVEVTYAGTSEYDLQSFRFELTYRDVGSTNVRTPEWLTEAKTEAG